jgi:hypothetical protein
LTKQIAITGHWSQSMGADLSGQQGMSAAISAVGIDAAIPAFAGAESGASTSPAIKKIASSLPKLIDIFTPVFSHDPAAIGTSPGSLIRQDPERMAQILNQLVAAHRETFKAGFIRSRVADT